MRTKNAVLMAGVIAALMSTAFTSCNGNQESSSSGEKSKITTISVTTTIQTDKSQTTTYVSDNSDNKTTESNSVTTANQNQSIINDTNAEVSSAPDAEKATVVTQAPDGNEAVTEELTEEEKQENERHNKVIELPIVPIE